MIEMLKLFGTLAVLNFPLSDYKGLRNGTYIYIPGPDLASGATATGVVRGHLGVSWPQMLPELSLCINAGTRKDGMMLKVMALCACRLHTFALQSLLGQELQLSKGIQ